MKRNAILFFCCLLTTSLFAQDSMEKMMEQRAREMYQVIGLNSPEQWKKFIEANYTKALIDKPMRAETEGGSSGGQTTATQTHEGNVEGKVAMYRRLHEDLGGGKVTSVKITGDKLDMIVISSDMTATFSVRFAKEKPYLIDGLGLQVGN